MGGALQVEVLYITTGLEQGGAEAALARLVNHPSINRLGVAVISLTRKGFWGPALEKMLPVAEIGMRRGHVPRPSEIFNFARCVRSYNPRILHGWMYHGNLAASFMKAVEPGSKRRVLWSIHHGLHAFESERRATRLAIRAGRWFSSTADKIIFNSRSCAEQHAAIGYPSDRFLYAPSGIDSAQFKPDALVRAELREKYGLRSDTIIVGTCARFHPVKDIPTLLRAAAIAGQLFSGVHDVRYLLAGEGMTSSNGVLTELISGCGLTGRVILAGAHPDTSKLIPGFDVSLLTSKSEAAPYFLLESMSCGVPVVATNVGDCAALISDTGLVAPAGNERAIASALAALVNDTSHRRTLGDAARARAIKEFDPDAAVLSYVNLYQTLLAKKSS